MSGNKNMLYIAQQSNSINNNHNNYSLYADVLSTATCLTNEDKFDQSST